MLALFLSISTVYDNFIFARIKLYALLQRQIPSSKISFSKKTLRTEECDGKVHIFCSDSTTYEGDILIGTDGAFSSVRQSLYKRMDGKGVLPKSDLECLSIAYASMVGKQASPISSNRVINFLLIEFILRLFYRSGFVEHSERCEPTGLLDA